MTEGEVQARATLAAALIQSGVVDVEHVNIVTHWRLQPNLERLHQLVDHLYRTITESRD